MELHTGYQREENGAVRILNLELKKVVDDSYEIEVGFELEHKLIEDIQNGLVGKLHKCHFRYIAMKIFIHTFRNFLITIFYVLME